MIDDIIMYCDECGWVTIDAEDVHITMNLKNDNVEYNDTCSNDDCDCRLFNSRRAHV